MKRIAILMSDTGGGHRAAANAITAGLEMRYPGMVHVDFIDMFRQYALFPMSRAPEIYPFWLRYGLWTYVFQWRFLDLLLSRPFMMRPEWGWLYAGDVRDIAKRYQPDLLVIVHAAFSRSTVAGRDYAGLNLPICSVVLDPGEGAHNSWFHPNLDLCLVPCNGSYARARAMGVPQERLKQIGFPVRPQFARYRESRADAKRELGWAQDRPSVLLVGGADGVGSLEAIATAIHDGAPETRLAVVCGKNEKLRRRLETRSWQRPPNIYGFVKNIEVMVRAADLIVMKGGPASVFEAALMETPMIISGAIPYQETGSSQLAVDAGAGKFCTEPAGIARATAELLQPGNRAHAEMAAACRKLIAPEAVFDAADQIAGLLGLPPSTEEDTGAAAVRRGELGKAS